MEDNSRHLEDNRDNLHWQDSRRASSRLMVLVEAWNCDGLGRCEVPGYQEPLEHRVLRNTHWDHHQLGERQRDLGLEEQRDFGSMRRGRDCQRVQVDWPGVAVEEVVEPH